MNNDSKLLLKKTMTKKSYKERMKSRRSTVGLGMSLGTVSHKSSKDYKRIKRFDVDDE